MKKSEIEQQRDALLQEAAKLEAFLTTQSAKESNPESDDPIYSYQDYSRLNRSDAPASNTFNAQWGRKSARPAPSHLPNKKSMSFRTKIDPNECLSARIIFHGEPHVSVSNYRNQVYNGVNINGNDVFRIHDRGKLSIPKSLKNSTQEVTSENLKDEHYYADIELRLSGKKWRPIPSLTAYDELYALKADVGVKIGFSISTHMFYAKLEDKTAKTQPVRLQYNLRSLGSIKNLKNLKLHSEQSRQKLEKILRSDNSLQRKLDQLRAIERHDLIVGLYDYFNHFTEKPMPEDSDSWSALQKLDWIVKNQAGVCEQRAVAFACLAEKLKIPTHIIENDVHAYVEIKLPDEDDGDEFWHIADLGGGDVQIKYESGYKAPTSLNALLVTEILQKNHEFDRTKYNLTKAFSFLNDTSTSFFSQTATQFIHKLDSDETLKLAQTDDKKSFPFEK